MKRSVAMLALGFVAALTSGLAEAEPLVRPVPNREILADPGPLLRLVTQDPVNARIEIVGARAELIDRRTATLDLDLPGGLKLTAKQRSFEVMESGNQVWVGSIAGFEAPGPVAWARTIPLDEKVSYLIAVRDGDTVLASIRVGGELWRLIPIDRGLHALVEVDQSRFLPDETPEAYAEMLANSTPWSKIEAGKPEDFSVVPKAISTIRVLVAFGPAARAAVANPQQTMDLAFTESNNALAATNTDVRLQQAGSIQNFNQTESTNYSTMLSRLTNLSDGWYDAIGTQRNNNAADMVAYVAPASTGLCGQAAGIATSNANAYFVMNPQCLTGNYTFVHEAGHVVGARHDNDPTTTPFAYGHGYVMASINRRTVMAVNNGPCSTCTRIGAFSSPNYTLQGVPIGTANFNDNTRVWRTRGPTVAAFR